MLFARSRLARIALCWKLGLEERESCFSESVLPVFSPCRDSSVFSPCCDSSVFSPCCDSAEGITTCKRKVHWHSVVDTIPVHMTSTYVHSETVTSPMNFDSPPTAQQHNAFSSSSNMHMQASASGYQTQTHNEPLSDVERVRLEQLERTSANTLADIEERNSLRERESGNRRVQRVWSCKNENSPTNQDPPNVSQPVHPSPPNPGTRVWLPPHILTEEAKREQEKYFIGTPPQPSPPTQTQEPRPALHPQAQSYSPPAQYPSQRPLERIGQSSNPLERIGQPSTALSYSFGREGRDWGWGTQPFTREEVEHNLHWQHNSPQRAAEDTIEANMNAFSQAAQAAADAGQLPLFPQFPKAPTPSNPPDLMNSPQLKASSFCQCCPTNGKELGWGGTLGKGGSEEDLRGACMPELPPQGMTAQEFQQAISHTAGPHSRPQGPSSLNWSHFLPSGATSSAPAQQPVRPEQPAQTQGVFERWRAPVLASKPVCTETSGAVARSSNTVS